MANRVFQGVVYQMKDAIDRMVGVVDETGTIISCSDLNRIGEVRDGIASDRLTAGDAFVRDGYTYHLFSSNKRNDYAVLVEGTDEPALRYAALLAISLQNIKQYHDEKFDKANFIKNVVLDNILPGDIYAKARELHFATDVSRVVLLIRVTSGADISAYDVVSGLFPDKQKDFVFNISENDTVLVKEIKRGIDQHDIESWPPALWTPSTASITSRPLWASHAHCQCEGPGPELQGGTDRHGGGQGVRHRAGDRQLRPSGHRPPDLSAAHHAVRDVPERSV